MAIFQQVRRKTVAERMASDSLVDACQASGFPDGLLQADLTYVMAAHNAGARVFGQPVRGKDILPNPLAIRVRALAFQRKGEVDRATSSGQILFM